MQVSMAHRIITSHDGSHTLESDRFDVTYHSHFGAVEESLTVFLSAGYHAVRLRHKPDQLDILELGMGTGLNAYLSLLESQRYSQMTSYTGIEAYPIDAETAQQLNYPSVLGDVQYQDHLLEMHRCPAGQVQRVTDYFTFTKHLALIQAWTAPQQYDVIYFDAFAPTSQPELWSLEILQQMYDCTKPGGTLVTYCAKGQVKRDLRSAGYTVESLPGPGKKREITRAWRSL